MYGQRWPLTFVPDMEKKRLIISTNGLNREGGRVLSSGARLENYSKNPVLLFGHQIWSLPIGRLEDIQTDSEGIMSAVPVFDEEDDMALAIKRKWENNFLFAASIHFKPITLSSDPALVLPGQMTETVTEWDLMEVSIVTVPGNGGAATGVMLDAFSENAIPQIKIQPEMDLKKIAVALGLSEGADEAAVLAAIEKVKTDKATLLSAHTASVLAIGREKGVVTNDNEAAFTALAAKDLDSVKAIIEQSKPAEQTVTTEAPKPEAKPAGQTLTGMLSAGAGKTTTTQQNTDDRAAWSFDDWSQKDQKGLLEMKKNDPTRYQALASARYEQMAVK